ncbi:MAG: hypothetical protein ILA11_02830 [Butyrivibrio sp.]|nr:hypothetical protein [Butyrivibrio sp.]
MARVLNLLIIILELVAFKKAFKWHGLKKNFIYYTQISNLLTLFSSIFLVIFGGKEPVEVLRFVSVCMLIMTFFVTACILVPMSGMLKELLFSGSGIFHHLLIPIISTLSYMLIENRVSLKWMWLPAAVTLAYGLIMLYFNYTKRLEGPYPFFLIRSNGVKMTVVWMACLLLVVSAISFAVGYHSPKKSDLKFIFVHGFSGWGSYDTQYEYFPYWGTSHGDIIRYLNEKGYESYAASVDPKGSAWDRACELYAQLTGTRVDYGKAHSEKAGHERFGRDYSKQPLLNDFADSRFVLIGHSFGGATVRLFSELIRNGSQEEIAATDPDDLSDFFKGGGGDGLFAVVTLAAPTNGTTAYDLYEDEAFDVSEIYVPEEYIEKSKRMSGVSTPVYDGRQLWDYAAFDMHIDNALAMNETITTFDDVFYFAYPCVSTKVGENGLLEPDPEITEGLFIKGSTYMSRYTGTTAGGFKVDESWQPNDGLVNTISAGAPIGAPSTEYKEGQPINPGVWNVMPATTGDHMSLQGGLTKRVNVKPFYLKLVKMITMLFLPI